MRPTSSQETTFGYLTALETTEHGFLGGYLIVSPLGRPLEFHCTAPIRPSRAQQILYGPTLQPYLIGEQIGRALFGKAERTPKVILTDQPAVLCLRSHTSVPIVQLLNEESNSIREPLSPNADLLDETEREGRYFGLDEHRWTLPEGFDTDRDSVTRLLRELSRHVELSEPFGRIHEAIREALRIGPSGHEAHGQAA